MPYSETYERLMTRIMILNERVWEGRAPRAKIDAWLENFTGLVAEPETERLHALFWLSQYMYFGSREIRVLLRSLFRDLFLCPLIQDVKRTLDSDATDQQLQQRVYEELDLTRFVGVGNPSESGVHLLYYFRQENSLTKDHFVDAVQIFRRTENASGESVVRLKNENIRRYVFLDDICGSGKTASAYSDSVLKDIQACGGDAMSFYYCLFATSSGLSTVRNETLFSQNCGAVFELDPSYRCVSPQSRYLATSNYLGIDSELASKIVREYGRLLGYPEDEACGFGDAQMLMGFHHNTPDTTIPIIWHDPLAHQGQEWTPVFKRYPKNLGVLE